MRNGVFGDCCVPSGRSQRIPGRGERRSARLYVLSGFFRLIRPIVVPTGAGAMTRECQAGCHSERSRGIAIVPVEGALSSKPRIPRAPRGHPRAFGAPLGMTPRATRRCQTLRSAKITQHESLPWDRPWSRAAQGPGSPQASPPRAPRSRPRTSEDPSAQSRRAGPTSIA
jgi:hypothetical protein